jgi:hypothetical protein
VYTRERKHIGTKWSRVTCLTIPLVAAQSLDSQVLEDSQSRWRLTIERESILEQNDQGSLALLSH